MISYNYSFNSPSRVGEDLPQTMEAIQQAWLLDQGTIDGADDYEDYMRPTGDFENPLTMLPGFVHAATYLRRMLLERGEGKVLIYGDYDADGITSSSILEQFFSYFLRNEGSVNVFIPDRIKHGYGPSDFGIRAVPSIESYDLIVLVDTGSGMRDQIVKLKEVTNADILIIDHHQPEDGDFPVLAHLNPRLSLEHAHDFVEECSAAGLAYLLVEKLCEEWEVDEGMNLDALQVVGAIGTVADVVNLRGVNRWIVTKAIELAAQDDFLEEKLPELCCLIYEMGACGFDEKTVGWKIAPALNALSRMGVDTSIGLKLFLPSNESFSGEVAAKLCAVNEERKKATEAGMEALLGPNSVYPKFEPNYCHLYLTGMSEGLIGIAAGRLSQSYNSPVFVGAIRGDIVKFSGRSPDSRVSLGEIMAIANKRGIIISGGGHAQACGFSILREKLELFTNLLDEMVPKGNFARQYPVIGKLNCLKRPSLWVDLIEDMRPFGGPQVQRPFVHAPEMKVLTHPLPLARRSDNKTWAIKFHLGGIESGGLEVICTDLDLCSSISRGQVIDCILQPEVSESHSGSWVNWHLIDFNATPDKTAE